MQRHCWSLLIYLLKISGSAGGSGLISSAARQ